MRTEPADLTDAAVATGLRTGWGLQVRELRYHPVGFGCHHWLVDDAAGQRWFVTVADLAARLRDGADTTAAAFERLERALQTALSLRDDAGLDFVVAPVQALDSSVVRRVTDRYALAVHPCLPGAAAGQDGEFASAGDRRAVLDMLSVLHAAPATPPDADDLVVPGRSGLATALDELGTSWDAGPYGRRARQLLARHASGLEVLLRAYDRLVQRVAARPERVVITHGEPHASNVLRTDKGLLLIDWDTVLLAPPERDLWGLAEADESILAAYTAVTSVGIDVDALSLYRLWFDLAEICCYIRLFRGDHAESADAAESWRNLQYFLRPAVRWPELVQSSRPRYVQGPHRLRR